MAFPHVARAGCLALALASGMVTLVGPMTSADAAEKDDLSKARAKFQQATELEQAGNHGNALQLFREVGQVRMTPQVRFHIASCEEKLGKLVAALGGYELALAEAESLGPEFQKEVEDRASALRSRIPKLVIERGEGAQAATIELDGVSLGASSVGVEVPLDPGPHTVQAKAPGYKQYMSTVEVSERQVEKVTVELAKLADEEKPLDAPKDVPKAPPPPVRHTVVLPIGIATVAAGAAAWATSGIFYVLQRGKDSDLAALCGTDADCTNNNPRELSPAELAKARSMNSSLRTYTTVSQIGVVAGIILPLAGAGMIALDVFVLSKPKPATATPDTTAWTLQPSAPGAELGGLSVVGSF
jgi:hypothetical protein